ncbi:MAG: hypothetical protein IKP29_10180, partial [Pseudobutyrivibrio sp.]|nr:hypothetical protein [Pseudobutyrivibrio sp.]
MSKNFLEQIHYYIVFLCKNQGKSLNYIEKPSNLIPYKRNNDYKRESKEMSKRKAFVIAYWAVVALAALIIVNIIG